MINGVINVNKPEGWTSQDVCAKLRSRLHIKKIGHTGTLDPMATGVLPICIAKATRIIEYYDADYKSYRATMKLGFTSDTLDITGEISETSDYADVSEKDVREAFKAYTGVIEQLPPKYSALKVDGKRAYELAREGKDFELSKRKIEIVSNQIIDFNAEEGTIIFDVTCSKGTYIRTMIDDIGRTLDCGAVMTALERTRSGYFRIEDSVGIEELCAMDDSEIEKYVNPMDVTLINLGIIELDDNRVTAFINGNESSNRTFTVKDPSNFNDLYRVYSCERFLGVGSVEDGILRPAKVLI